MPVELIEMARGLARTVKSARGRILISKDEYLYLLEQRAPQGTDIKGDDWVWNKDLTKTIYPSPFASLVVNEKRGGKIFKTAISNIGLGRPGFTVLADGNGCYIYDNEEDEILPVVSVDPTFIANNEVPIDLFVYGLKGTEHWLLINDLLKSLIRKGIRTTNIMGHALITYNYFFNYRRVEGGAEIIPRNAVVTEPYLNRPTKDSDALLLSALRKLSPEFFFSDMSGGENIFNEERLARVTSCEIEPHCADGWIFGPRRSVSEVLLSMREALEIVSLEDIYELPEDDRSRISVLKLINDLNHFEP
ncbi:MAG: hypothetical protein KAQ64_01700 [Candidatus Pacebacteria bacterium]|nr:hypothetical protein [Candidatus Paceibacterota bacterium]